jgi:hypothetical protein
MAFAGVREKVEQAGAAKVVLKLNERDPSVGTNDKVQADGFGENRGPEHHGAPCGGRKPFLRRKERVLRLAASRTASAVSPRRMKSRRSS